MRLLDATWQNIEQRYQELSDKLSDSALDHEVRSSLQKEYTYFGELLHIKDQLDEVSRERAAIDEQHEQTDDAELRALFEEEIEQLAHQKNELICELDIALYPADDLANRSTFLEIRAGTGGQEAALFAGDLLRMYSAYALKKGWKVSITHESLTDLGGYREVVLHIQGKGVYGLLKHESGVHRVQRVPSTEGGGRIHTSTATVAVLPEAKEVDFSINPNDLRIDVYRASGAGGQHVNTTDSAVRITHIPTGVVVSCQDERSQHKNKAKAMKMLQSRLLLAEKERQEAEERKERQAQVGTGMRSEKVRTYNFPQNRMTDHTVGLTLNKLDIVMTGELDELMEALQKKERETRRIHPLLKPYAA